IIGTHSLPNYLVYDTRVLLPSSITTRFSFLQAKRCRSPTNDVDVYPDELCLGVYSKMQLNCSPAQGIIVKYKKK
ncbi:cytochrome C oxidase subunit III, partial [Sesbania bispinosa]